MRKQLHLVVLTLALAGLGCVPNRSGDAGSTGGDTGGGGSNAGGGAGGTGGGTNQGGAGGGGSAGGGASGSGGRTGSGGAGGSGGGGLAGSGGGGLAGSGGSDRGGSAGTGGAAGAGGTTTTAGTTGGGGATGTGGATVSPPFPSQACIDRATALVGQMTADEKYAQMLQMEREGLATAQVTQYAIGSAFSQGGSAPATNSPAGWADMADGYRQAALASRLKIPFLYGADEVHGIGTVKGAVVFPHNIGLGATRDNALVAEIAAITARESLGCGVDFVFSPVVAVALNERWGRTYEAFGETTDLASTMGSIMIKGLQFTSTGGPTGILADAKHYLGDGGTANGVNTGTVTGDEAALRAIHLTPYRAAVAARVGSIMASFSSWQGTKMHLNKAMLTDVLKGELGFGGFIVSDFNACYQLGLSNQDGIGQCLNAGIDMFMSWGQSIPNMLGYFQALMKAGTIPQSRVDDAVRRIVTVKCEMGLFEASGKVDRKLTDEVGSAAHRQVARKAVQESLVLLKNDGNVLPLAKSAAVALGGKNADDTGNQCGGWTISWQGASGSVPGATSVRQAFESVVGASQVKYSADGKTTSGASVGVAVIGETPYAESKGDSTDLTVAASDVSVVKAMKDAGLKTVVVLIAGRPMILDPLMAYADAIVVAWLPGSEGAGVTDILYGDAKPSGKLPHSWPRSMSQIPINTGDATYDPLYAYGYGLTY
jgi:beta-glucosidase